MDILKHTFHGYHYRVQLTIFSGLTYKYNTETRCGEEYFTETRYMVMALPQEANRNAAFWRGEQLYYGTSQEDAFRAIGWSDHYLSGQRQPKRVAKFLANEAVLKRTRIRGPHVKI
jgi:hypothetical protein